MGQGGYIQFEMVRICPAVDELQNQQEFGCPTGGIPGRASWVNIQAIAHDGIYGAIQFDRI